jgi:predicted MFS family arabinose efflux permease
MSSAAADDLVEGSNFDRSLVAPHENDQFWSREFVELLVSQFTFGLSYSLFYLLPKYLRTELRATGAQIGLVMGTALISAVAATPLAVWWLGRGARRLPALLGVLVTAAVAVAFTRVTHVGAFLLTLRAIQGVAFCLFGSAVATRAAELIPSARLAQAMGYVGLAALVTNALSPLVAEYVATRWGWSAAFLLAAAYGLAAFVVTMRVGDSPRSRISVRGHAVALAERSLAKALYATIVCGVALGVLFTYTQPLALERGAQQVGRLFTGYVVGATTVRLLFSSLADRVGRARVSAAAFMLYAAVVVLTFFLTPGGLLWCGIGFGIAHGLLFPALNAMTIENATPQTRGTAATLFGGAFNLGYAVSVFGLGVVADTLGYASVFLATAAVTLTGALVLVRTRARCSVDRAA